MEEEYDVCDESGNTCNLTIEVDEAEDEDFEKVETPENEAPAYIGKPIPLSEVECHTNEMVTIADLSETIREIICSHLDLPPYGTLRNWESIASKFDLKNETIMMFSKEVSPTKQLLKRIAMQPANKLFVAIAEANRLDTLFSLRSYVNEGMEYGQAQRKQFYALESTSEHNFYSATTSIVPTPRPLYSEDDKVILVTHYEVDEDHKKTFDLIRKILRKRLKSYEDYKLVDIDKIKIEENFTNAIHDAFQKAIHIVVCFSPSYKPMLFSQNVNQKIRMRQYLHQLMDNEYQSLGSINRRFRPLLFPEGGNELLSVGWASSTYVYSFPEDMPELLKRIFLEATKRNQNQNITT